MQLAQKLKKKTITISGRRTVSYDEDTAQQGSISFQVPLDACTQVTVILILISIYFVSRIRICIPVLENRVSEPEPPGAVVIG